jgi:hypothetical protein
VIAMLFTIPLALRFFSETFLPHSAITPLVAEASFTSPFAAAFALPIDLQMPGKETPPTNWPLFFSFLGFYGLLNCGLLGAMVWLFNTRWRVAD